MNHRNILFLLIMFSSSCQTTQYLKTPLPISVDRLFGQCQIGEGGIFLRVKQQGAVLFATEADWVAKQAGWTIEAYNAFGQTMGSIVSRHKEHQITVKSSAVKGGALSLSPTNEILYDGHFVGVISEEVPCLLRQKFPAAWKSKISKFALKERSATLRIEHKQRQIDLTINGLGKKTPDFCAMFSWSQYLGLVRNNFEYCYLESGDKANLTFSNGVSIEWSKVQTI